MNVMLLGIVLATIVLTFMCARQLYDDEFHYVTKDRAQNDAHFPPRIIIGRPYPSEENIFFIETSCALHKKTSEKMKGEPTAWLHPRGACAVESAARANPLRPIYLAHTCPVHVENLHTAPPYFVAALRARNVRLWPLHFDQMFVNSPLATWFSNGTLRKTIWPTIHSSDVLRFLLLWKYGGTYIDTDVLMMRSLMRRHNFACAESAHTVSVGAFDFGLDALGRRYANACLSEIIAEYKPDSWAHNGPGVITRTMQKICKLDLVYGMNKGRCAGFDLVPTSQFYPVPCAKHEQLFRDHKLARRYVEKVTQGATGVHMWNNFTRSIPVNKSSGQPYAVLARKLCPKVVAALPSDEM